MLTAVALATVASTQSGSQLSQMAAATAPRFVSGSPDVPVTPPLAVAT